MKQIITKLISKFKPSKTKKSKSTKLDPKKAKLIRIGAIAASGRVVVGVAIYLFLRDPSFLLVAKVNNTYITRSELNKVLIKSYGQQALEDIAYKKMAAAEFEKNKIEVSQSELDAKLAEIEQSLGGAKLEDALNANGMTMEELRENIVLQTSLEKLLKDKIVVTQEDIAAFLTQFTEQMKGMTDEEKVQYAQKQLEQQGLQEEMSKWFEEMKQNAKIKYYL
ncbi:MAG: hypothetical protein WC243_03120 [Patescibacteria group bacterium]|jgi:foldase protein PrsA